MTLENPHALTVECFRCGYDLRGIADTQPCPECGLLAARSRRATDELHETRPKWLGSLSRAVNLILLAIVVATVWPLASEAIVRLVSQFIWTNYRRINYEEWTTAILCFGFVIAGLLLLLGAFFLTGQEGYEPADRKDRHRRIGLRFTAIIPTAALALAFFHMERNLYGADYFFLSGIGFIPNPGTGIADLLVVGMIPFVLLLFFHLRAIAKRARSAHLAEHCSIVGIGTAATLLYIAAVLVIMEMGDHWFGAYWVSRSNATIPLLLILSVFGCLFIVWSLYLLVRFAISFHRAAKLANEKWTRDDRALDPP